MRLTLIFAFMLCAPPVLAEGFRPITDRSAFVEAVADRALTRLGVRLHVTPAGGIGGRAFGLEAVGRWEWRDGYFCREIAAGTFRSPMDCQRVLRAGSTLRFVADRGRGDSADLRLD